MTDAAESTPAVADLFARARVYVEGSHAKQTLEAYAADWKHFSTWCEEHKRRSLPAAPETIICYLVETADSYRVATLDRRLASISYHHKQARHQLPTKDPEVERTMRGIRRAKGMAPNGKAPLLPTQLQQAIDDLPDTLLGKRDHGVFAEALVPLTIPRIPQDSRERSAQCICGDWFVLELIVNDLSRSACCDAPSIEQLLKLMWDDHKAHPVIQSFVDAVHSSVRDKDVRSLKELKLGYR